MARGPRCGERLRTVAAPGVPPAMGDEPGGRISVSAARAAFARPDSGTCACWQRFPDPDAVSTLVDVMRSTHMRIRRAARCAARTTLDAVRATRRTLTETQELSTRARRAVQVRQHIALVESRIHRHNQWDRTVGAVMNEPSPARRILAILDTTALACAARGVSEMPAES
jgi:hypothetical protein